jgi:hypothetical protein
MLPRRLLFMGLLSLAFFASTAWGAEPPRLAVLVYVDQLRGDYLTRWDALFGEGGFHRREPHVKLKGQRRDVSRREDAQLAREAAVVLGAAHLHCRFRRFGLGLIGLGLIGLRLIRLELIRLGLIELGLIGLELIRLGLIRLGLNSRGARAILRAHTTQSLRSVTGH